jgi:hypothetical protein
MNFYKTTPSTGKGRGEDSPSAARDDRIAFEEFKKATGRTDTDPYGYSGMFYEPGKNRLLGREGGRFGNEGLTQRAIDRINRMSYDQYRGLVSGKGYRKGGKGAPVPGYAPALKIGEETPMGRVVAAPTQPKRSGIASLSPALGLLDALFGRSRILRTLDDGGVNYSTEGIETLDVLPPGPTAPAPVDTGSGFTLVGAQPRKDNSLFNLEGFIKNVPKSGVGQFVDQVQEKFNMGPGELVAQQDPQAFARDQALADQNRTQLEYPTVEDRGSLYGRSNPIPVQRKSLYEGLAAPGTGLRLEDIVGPNKIADLSDLSDSAIFGSPYAGTTGAFVPKRVEIGPDGKLIEVPVGF